MLLLSVSRDDNGRRLDRVLRKAFPHVPPGALAGAIRRGAVRINGKRCRNETRVNQGDTIRTPSWAESETERASPGNHDAVRLERGSIVGGSLRVPVIHRCTDWIVLNKPAGIPTHGDNSLEQMVRAVARHEGWWEESLSFRPGPVHRLDRNTSGVQLFALTAEGARYLSEILSRGALRKIYVAVVDGIMREKTTITTPLRYDNTMRKALTVPAGDTGSIGSSSKEAITEVVPLFVSDRDAVTLAAAIPRTGRTHQIRAHCASIGHPLEWDRKYGGSARPMSTHYLLHGACIAATDGSFRWDAPFAAETARALHRRFPRLDSLQERIHELVRTTCTVASGPDTMGP